MFNIVGKRKIWFSLSTVSIVASVACIAIFGLNFGIDFTGGSLMDVQVEGESSTDEVRSLMAEIGQNEARVQSGEPGEYLIRTSALSEEEHQAILTAMGERFGEVREDRFDFIGPVIGSELTRKAIFAVVVVLILIMLYVAYAFRHVSDPVKSWKYGVLTMVTAFHDVIVPVGVFALLGHFFGFQVDSAFVAAVLTILGYSINDTIVVFDRTRENLGDWSTSDSFEAVVNRSVNQTLTRSLNTGMGTLLALVAVTLFGGETTQQFALALIVGIVVGTYSSIFIASPLLVVWEKRK